MTFDIQLSELVDGKAKVYFKAAMLNPTIRLLDGDTVLEEVKIENAPVVAGDYIEYRMGCKDYQFQRYIPLGDLC